MFCFPKVGHVMLNTPENRYFQILSYSREYVRTFYEKSEGLIDLRPSLGEQNIQAKEVCSVRGPFFSYGVSVRTEKTSLSYLWA